MAARLSRERDEEVLLWLALRRSGLSWAAIALAVDRSEPGVRLACREVAVADRKHVGAADDLGGWYP